MDQAARSRAYGRLEQIREELEEADTERERLNLLAEYERIYQSLAGDKP